MCATGPLWQGWGVEGYVLCTGALDACAVSMHRETETLCWEGAQRLPGVETSSIGSRVVWVLPKLQNPQC